MGGLFLCGVYDSFTDYPLAFDHRLSYISFAGRRDVSRYAAVALIFFMDVLIIRVSLIPV